jgi:hypothetical protein
MTKKRDFLRRAQNLLEKPRAAISVVMVGISAQHMAMKPGTTPDEQRQAAIDQIGQIEEWREDSKRRARDVATGRPSPPAPTGQILSNAARGTEDTLKRDKRYTPPQPPRQGQEPRYDLYPPNREGRRQAQREARRASEAVSQRRRSTDRQR